MPKFEVEISRKVTAWEDGVLYVEAETTEAAYWKAKFRLSADPMLDDREHRVGYLGDTEDSEPWEVVAKVDDIPAVVRLADDDDVEES